MAWIEQLLLHDKTKEQVLGFLQAPSHGLLISGPPGSGKQTLAIELSAQLLGVTTDKLSQHPYFVILSKPNDKQEIPIDTVRQLINSLKLKPAISGSGVARRVVFIDEAQLLSEEAQNALLKLLEEPPQSTTFILTVPTDKNILPTVASRLQRISINPVGLVAAQAFFEKTHPPAAVASAWSLSQGAAGLTSAILREDKDHPLKQAVDLAKKFLKMSRYERVIYLDGLSSDKQNLTELIDGLNRVLAALQRSAVAGGKDSLSKRVLKSRQLVNSALDSLQMNTSTRLICLNLALSLPL